VLRVTAIDRPGLLGEIATIVGELRMNIVASDINLERGESMVQIEIVMGHSMPGAGSRATHADLLQKVLALSGVLRAEVDNW
jgi:UTP:GlnB (protein PII) uridylyltransferase